MQSNLVTLPAALSDLPSQSNTAELLYSNRVVDQQPNMEERILAETSGMQKNLICLAFHGNEAFELIGYKTSTSLDWKRKPDGVASKDISLDCFRFL